MHVWLPLLVCGVLIGCLKASDVTEKSIVGSDISSSTSSVKLTIKKKKKQRWTDEELKAMAAADAAGPSSILVGGVIEENIDSHNEGPLSRLSVCLFRLLQLVNERRVDDVEKLYRIESFLEGLLEFFATIMEELQVKFDSSSFVQSFLEAKFDLLIAGMDVEPQGYLIVSRDEMISSLEEVIEVAPSLLTSASECSTLAIQLHAMASEEGSLLPFVRQLVEEAEYIQYTANIEQSLSSLITSVHGRLFAVNKKSHGGFKLNWPFSSLAKPSNSPALKDQKRFLKFLDVLETVITRGLKAPQVVVSFFRTFNAIGNQFSKMTASSGEEEESFISQVEEHLESLPFVSEEDVAVLSAPLEEALFEEIKIKALVRRIQVDKTEFPDSDDEYESREKRRRRPRRRPSNDVMNSLQSNLANPISSANPNPANPIISANLNHPTQQTNQQELLRQLLSQNSLSTNANPATSNQSAQMTALLSRMGENQLPELSGPSLVSYVKKSSLPRLLNSLIKARFGVDVLKSLGQVLKVLNEVLGAVEVVLRTILRLIQFVRYYCLQAAQFVTELSKEEVSLQDDHSVPLRSIQQLPVNKGAEMLSSGLTALTGPVNPFQAGLQGAVRKAQERGELLRQLPGPLLLTILHTSFIQLSSSKGVIVSAMGKKHSSFGEMNSAATQAFIHIYESITAADPTAVKYLDQCPVSVFAEILVSFLMPARNTVTGVNKQLGELVKFLKPMLAVTGSEAQLSMLAYLLAEEDVVRLIQIAPESKSYFSKLSQKMKWLSEGCLKDE